MLWICLSFVSLVLGPVDAKTPDADSQGRELLKNPTFATDAAGWILREATPEKTIRHGESESVQLAGVQTGPQSWSHAGVTVSPVPCDRELQFSLQAAIGRRHAPRRYPHPNKQPPAPIFAHLQRMAFSSRSGAPGRSRACLFIELRTVDIEARTGSGRD
jgi:hypothetical protein